MFAPFPAKRVAVSTARRRAFSRPVAAALTAALLLSGCVPATTPLAGRDPADPTAKVAAVGYRSTLAPYTSLRPVAPAPWGERGSGGSQPPDPDRQERKP